MSDFLPSFLKTYKLQRDMVDFLKCSESWSKKDWHNYQLNHLISLLHHCEDNVPYYGKIFNKHNIKIDQIDSFDDFQKIPFLTRKEVRLHTTELKVQNFPSNDLQLEKTSGTSEKPLEFYIQKKIWLAYHLAFNRMYMKRAGYERGMRIVSLRGMEKKSRRHLLFNTLELSSLYLHDNFQTYIRKIESFNPSFIVSYPSAIYFLAKYLNEHEITAPFEVRAIFCHGEPVYDWQRTTIENIFNCKVFDIYGNGEKNVLSATCEHSSLHHIFPNYCVVELIDGKGNPITEEDAPGEIVSTGLLSYIFPFIRYRTGDVGIYTDKHCSCEREYPLIKKISGRLSDGVITKQNTLVSSFHLNGIINEYGNGISKWQCIQCKKGELQLQIMIYIDKKCSSLNIKKRIEEGFKLEVPNQFDLKISVVDAIDQKHFRKHRFLIQEIPLDYKLLRSKQ